MLRFNLHNISRKSRHASLLAIFWLTLVSPFSFAEDAETTPVINEIEALKQQVIELNRDLFILEEDLLFPANTQFVIFLSVDVGQFFNLDAVEVKIDGETITSYLYTEKQIKALHRGGMQRLYTGNLRSGEHELTAFITGIGPNGRDYKLGTTQKFDKGSDIKSLELRITDSTRKYQPEFTVVEWE